MVNELARHGAFSNDFLPNPLRLGNILYFECWSDILSPTHTAEEHDMLRKAHVLYLREKRGGKAFLCC
jgi:hypothetical protein